MGFKDGDFVKIEYTAWRAADEQIVYTTDENKAKESGVHYDNSKYGPQLVVVGKSNVIKGLYEASFLSWLLKKRQISGLRTRISARKRKLTRIDERAAKERKTLDQVNRIVKGQFYQSN